MITLVVPIYNMEQYLPRCLDSIRAQTCPDFEVVLVDDGSTDASPALCDSFAASDPHRVRVIHKPNGGLSSARNAGIDAARGEFLIFPDPDDWLEPDYVEAFLNFQRQYQADLVSLGHYVDTDDGTSPGCVNSDAIVMDGPRGQHSLLLGPRIHGFSWSKLYRTDLIRAHGLRFPEQMGTTEDLHFAYRYLAHCRTVCHIPTRRVYHYCQREDSSTRGSFSPEKMNTIRTYEYIISDCAERDPDLAQAARDAICTAAVNLLWEYELTAQPDPDARSYLLSRIRRLLPGYLRQSRFGFGRKLQALLAAFSPRLFLYIKKAARRF